MNKGAHLIRENFFSDAELSQIVILAQQLNEKKSNVHQSGRYKDIKWSEVSLMNKQYNFVEKTYSFLGIDSVELCVFYYLEPGATLHPHRDLTGASYNSRIRFHVPIITNEFVDFRVSKRRVIMLPGQLWVLDTSYLHSVENAGTETRVHLVIECSLNDKIRTHLPSNGIKGHAHNMYFLFVLLSAFLKSIFVNIFFNPKYFFQQMSMLKRFIKWRFLRKKEH